MNYTPRPQVFYEPWEDHSHGFFVQLYSFK
jgi:hypothetical protein